MSSSKLAQLALMAACLSTASWCRATDEAVLFARFSEACSAASGDMGLDALLGCINLRQDRESVRQEPAYVVESACRRLQNHCTRQHADKYARTFEALRCAVVVGSGCGVTSNAPTGECSHPIEIDWRSELATVRFLERAIDVLLSRAATGRWEVGVQMPGPASLEEYAVRRMIVRDVPVGKIFSFKDVAGIYQLLGNDGFYLVVRAPCA